MVSEELEKRVKVLEDIDEIKDMHRLYIYYHARKKNFEGMIDCFAEDAIAEMGEHGVKKGKAEIAELLRQIDSEAKVKPDIPDEGEFLTQPIINIKGDKATGRWLLQKFWDDFTIPEDICMKMVQGRYDAEYVKENGKWKFSYLKWTMPWPSVA
jgi:hypothetical protein